MVLPLLKGKTDSRPLPRQSPPYWSKYAFVDINRDTHQQVHETTKAVHRMFHEWHPTVVHDLHESVALLLTWNGTGPYNPHIDPITYGEFLELSFHEVRTMTGLGMPGVSTWNFGEAFGHHYLDSVAMNHNSLGRGYETYGNGTAETLNAHLPPGRPRCEWYRPLPPPAPSRLVGARQRELQRDRCARGAGSRRPTPKEMLRNFYTRAALLAQRPREAPYAFVIPRTRAIPLRVAQMVGRLLEQHIEVGRRDRADVAEGSSPAGTTSCVSTSRTGTTPWICSLPQHYPKDGGEPTTISPGSFPRTTIWTRSRPRMRPFENAALPPLAKSRTCRRVAGAGPYSCSRTRARKTCSPRATASPASGSRSPSTRSGRRCRVPGRLLDSSRAGRTRSGPAGGRRRVGLDFASAAAVPDVPRHDAPRAAGRRLGALGRHRLDRLGPLLARPAQRALYLVRDEDIRAGACARSSTCCCTVTWTSSWPSRSTGCPRSGAPCPSRRRRDAEPRHARGVGRHHRRHRLVGAGADPSFVEDGGLMVTWAGARISPLEGGIVRGVRRSSGGVPRSSQGGGADAAAASQESVTRTPGSHLRVISRGPIIRLPTATPAHLCLPPEFPAVRPPRRWLRMAYCTTCLDGPRTERRRARVGRPGRLALVVSGQAWGEADLVDRPAILDLPAGMATSWPSTSILSIAI